MFRTPIRAGFVWGCIPFRAQSQQGERQKESNLLFGKRCTVVQCRLDCSLASECFGIRIAVGREFWRSLSGSLRPGGQRGRCRRRRVGFSVISRSVWAGRIPSAGRPSQSSPSRERSGGHRSSDTRSGDTRSGLRYAAVDPSTRIAPAAVRTVRSAETERSRLPTASVRLTETRCSKRSFAQPSLSQPPLSQPPRPLVSVHQSPYRIGGRVRRTYRVRSVRPIFGS